MPFETIDIQDISGSQMIKIPESLRIDDNKVYLKKVGDSLDIIPFHNPWQSMIESVESFSEDFIACRKQTDQQSRESLD